MANIHNSIVVHHTVTDQDVLIEETVDSINQSHKNRGFPQSKVTGLYVGYHYVIDAQGKVKRTRGDAEVGAHCKADNKNFEALGIAVIGDFEEDVLTKQQRAALQALLKDKVVNYSIPRDKITYHGQHKSTQCCGHNLIMALPEILDDVYENAESLGEWEKEALKWNKEMGIITKPKTAPFNIKQVAWFGEVFKKSKEIPEIDVHVYASSIKLTNREEEQLEQAIRDTVRFYGPYVNLFFHDTESIKLGELEVNSKKTELKGFEPKRGLNVIITEDKYLDDLRKKNVNGVMYHEFNTTIIERSLLLEEDSRNRGIVNAFACTLQHELSHWFGKRLEKNIMANDRTHKYDYDFTLANYPPKLAWPRLHDQAFRDKYNI